MILDALKGAVAVLAAKWMLNGGDAAWLISVAGIAVIVGHVFPVWLRFRGGKGVATGVGVFLALAPLAGIKLSLISLLAAMLMMLVVSFALTALGFCIV